VEDQSEQGVTPVDIEPDEVRDDFQLKRVRVLVETTERSFRGYVYMPAGGVRLSDHLNSYRKHFLCLDGVEISDRGKHYATGDSAGFVAIAISQITYIRPLDEDA
jgi:hypothetical protein